MSNLYSVILAGGSGSRLWPLSREMHPKHLMKMTDDYTLFQNTFLRLLNDTDDKNIISVTNVKNAPTVKLQLAELKEKFCRNTDYKIVTEPVSKNTAPAVALCVKYITEKIHWQKSDPIIIVSPSDQLILDEKYFSNLIKEGIKLAENGYIVTFGIKPKRTDVGFGYIKTQKNKKVSDISEQAQKVTEFIEKPELEEACEMAKSDKYLWNSGIFIFKASTINSEFKKHCPKIHKLINVAKVTKGIPSVEFSNFEKMPDISLDYAIMEKSKKLTVLLLDDHWYDMGSWESLYNLAEKDENNNYIEGDVVDIDSKNSMIYSTSKLVTTIGLEDTFVIETEDAVLVCDKSKVQDVKEVFSKLKEKEDITHSVHKTIYRPWGYYTVLDEGQGFLTKSITVNPGGKLSIQKHMHRSEHWVVVEGRALVVKGEEDYDMREGDSIDIAVEEVHSLQNPYSEPLTILEVQQGEILDENDIIRLEDIYGRA